MNALLPSLRQLLDDILGLNGKALTFDESTPLLNAVPELDSFAIAALLAALEDRYGVSFDDEDLQAEAFHSVGSLLRLLEQYGAR